MQTPGEMEKWFESRRREFEVSPESWQCGAIDTNGQQKRAGVGKNLIVALS